MAALKKMTGHPRLFRRQATYYRRAAVPQDIVDTYGKREETFSLRTKNRAEAVVRVRIEAARVDKLFAEHREMLARKGRLDTEPPLADLSSAQIARVKQACPNQELWMPPRDLRRGAESTKSRRIHDVPTAIPGHQIYRCGQGPAMARHGHTACGSVPARAGLVPSILPVRPVTAFQNGRRRLRMQRRVSELAGGSLRLRPTGSEKAAKTSARNCAIRP